MSVDMPVMAADDVMVTKLSAFEEHYIDFEGLLPIARALREQIDWSDVRRRTADRPIAVGFLALSEALGIAPRQRELRAVPEEPRIRVTTT